MWFEKKNRSLEDKILDNLDKGLDELNKAVNCLHRGNLEESRRHHEASKIRLEFHKACTGETEGVRDWILDLFNHQKG